MANIGSFIPHLREEWNVPGLAVGVVREGETLLLQGYGLRDRESEKSVTPQTLFAIGSCTKAFTCTALGILEEEGKLDWDRPVREYLPQFRVSDPYVSDHMTARDLVTHRSGLPRHDFLWYCTRFDRAEIFRRLRHLEFSKGFREVFQYNNLMYLAAGSLIERITGQTWEDFLRAKILLPLGMEHSNLSVEDSQKTDDFSFPYFEREDEIVGIPFKNIVNVGPAGSINSSVSEMVHWLNFNLKSGNLPDPPLLSEEGLKTIHSPQVVVPGEPPEKEFGYDTYGLGWGIRTYRNELLIAHGGGIDGFSSMVALLPKRKSGVVVLTNRGSNLAFIIAMNLLDEMLGMDRVPWPERLREKEEEGRRKEEEKKGQPDQDRVEGTVPSHPMADYAGIYEHPGYGTATITIDEEGLAADFNGVQFYRGTHDRYDIFEFEETTWKNKRKFAFEMNEKGRIVRLAVSLEDAVKPILFQRLDAQ